MFITNGDEIPNTNVQYSFNTKMKIEPVPLPNLMRESHLVEGNIDTMTCCFDNADYRLEHACYKYLDSFPHTLHGWGIGESPMDVNQVVASGMDNRTTFVVLHNLGRLGVKTLHNP